MGELAIWQMLLIICVATGIFFLALYAARFVQNWSEWCEDYVSALFEPIKELFVPLKEKMQGCTTKVTSLSEGIETKFPKENIWGNWKLMVLLGGGTIFAIVRGLFLLTQNGSSEVFSRIIANTTIGSFQMLAKDNFSVSACLQVVIIASVTDYFVKKCKELPIAVQLLYDVIFIVAFSLIFDLVSESLFDFVRSDWWNILQIDFNTEMFDNGGAFIEVVSVPFKMWAVLINILLKVLTIAAGGMLLIRAVGNVISAFCCSIASYAAIIGVGSLLTLLPGNKVGEILTAIVALLCIVAVELLVFNLDGVAGKMRERSGNMVFDQLLSNAREKKHVTYTQPYNWITVWIAGYLGSPCFYFGLLIGIAGIIQGAWYVIAIIFIFWFIYFITCIPGVILMKKRKDATYKMGKGIAGFVARTISFYPIMAGFIIKSAFRLLMNIVLHLGRDELITGDNPAFEWMMARKVE